MLLREEVPLVTLTGPGGIGKTRLAVEVARSLGGAFTDGVWFVDLAPLTDPRLVVKAIAAALAVPETGDQPLPNRLADFLERRELLLLLDNFEGVLAGAPAVAALLTASHHLTVLVTSRTLLRVSGEHQFPVPPLILPNSEGSPDQAYTAPAVRLFAERAAAISPGFVLTATNTDVVAEVCRRLDGLPLAIELAAAQSGVLPPPVLLARIRAQSPLPLAGPRDAPNRQRTMRDAVAWSYELLSNEERALFRRVGVFVGGFGLDAAESVFGRAERREEEGHVHGTARASPANPSVLEGLASLVGSSLLLIAAREGEPGFSMLDTIRGFALEQLVGSGEADLVNCAHADWCLALAEGSSLATLLPGAEAKLQRLEIEHANLRTALDWLDRRGDHDRLLRLAAALGPFWHAHGHVSEGRSWLERALSKVPDPTAHACGRALAELSYLLSIQGETERAEALLEESVIVLRAHDDVPTLTGALTWQGWIAGNRGDFPWAEQVLKEALTNTATIADPAVAASARANVLANLGVIAHGRGDLTGARALHEEALRTYSVQGNGLGAIRSLRDLGDVARDQHDYADAVACYLESLALMDDRGDLSVVADAREGTATAAMAWGHAEPAARLLGATEAVRYRLGAAVVVPADRAANQRAFRSARAALGEQGFQAAWSAGRALTVASAIAEAQAVAKSAPKTRIDGDHSGVTLSPREQEVLRLLASGLSNRAIADSLFVGLPTVKGHVRSILAKLGLTSRTAAAAHAHRHGLS